MKAVAVSWCGRTFSTTPIILAECTDTPTISGRLASFYFFGFLFHNIGISPLKLGIGTAFLGIMGTGTGYVDTHWVGGHHWEKHDLRQTASNYFLGMRKPPIFCIPSNHADGRTSFPKSWVAASE